MSSSPFLRSIACPATVFVQGSQLTVPGKGSGDHDDHAARGPTGGRRCLRPHAVAATNDDLKALIAAAPGFGGPGFLVPTRNSGLLRWCLTNGLRVVQPMTLMTVGLYNEPQGAYLPSIAY